MAGFLPILVSVVSAVVITLVTTRLDSEAISESQFAARTARMGRACSARLVAVVGALERRVPAASRTLERLRWTWRDYRTSGDRVPALGTSTAHGQRPERARRALLVGSVAVAMAAVLTTAWVLYPVNRGPQADSSPPAELAAAQFSDRIDASPGAQLYAGAPRGKTPAETAVATDDEPSEVSSEPYAGAPRGETPAETAAATDDEPSEISSEAAATPVTSPVGHTLYIANTGGVGVRLRTECADPSVRAGALVEGATVRVVREGLDSSCADWTLVQASGAGATWVRDRYLGATRPSPEPATISVISYEDYWVPVLELRIQKAWSADLTTNKGRTFRVGCLQDHWRAVGDTVITYGGAVIRDPAPAGCGFGPLEEVEQLSVPAR